MTIYCTYCFFLHSHNAMFLVSPRPKAHRGPKLTEKEAAAERDRGPRLTEPPQNRTGAPDSPCSATLAPVASLRPPLHLHCSTKAKCTGRLRRALYTLTHPISMRTDKKPCCHRTSCTGPITVPWGRLTRNSPPSPGGALYTLPTILVGAGRVRSMTPSRTSGQGLARDIGQEPARKRGSQTASEI